jgi:F-type H+-transporting ATPase subunit gamma
MSKIAHIKRRIKAVKNTKQITRAMQLVAASKMKRAQDRALAGQAYSNAAGTDVALGDLTIRADLHHPFMEAARSEETRDPCPYHRQGFVRSAQCQPLSPPVRLDSSCGFVTVGRKGKQFLSRTRRDLMADFSVSDKVTYGEVRPWSPTSPTPFSRKTLIPWKSPFPRFINTMFQQPVLLKILPIVDLEDCLDSS